MNVMKKMMKIKHYYQPTGNSCGPTCLYMVIEYILNKENDFPFDVEIKHNIKDICDMCGTDWIVGTPPDKMEKGMKALSIKYIEYISSPRPYELLKQVIDDGNIAIIRTITDSVPHWIIISDYSEDVFNILDPWKGERKGEEKDLDKIWKLRDYKFFEVIIPKK